MRIWAISDLHLSFSGAKPMDLFGDHWADHASKVESGWRELVSDEDVVCLPGDFSWAMRLDEASEELAWLGNLPGRKIMIRGNHDYWWGSVSKLRKALPESVSIIQHDSLVFDGVGYAGSRGWTDPTLDLSAVIPCCEAKCEGGKLLGEQEDRRIYERELGRLDKSLASLDPGLGLKVALLHFPPCGTDMKPTPVTDLLEEHGVDIAVFGHLHLACPTDFANPFGVARDIRYYLASADFVDFTPILLAETG